MFIIASRRLDLSLVSSNWPVKHKTSLKLVNLTDSVPTNGKKSQEAHIYEMCKAYHIHQQKGQVFILFSAQQALVFLTSCRGSGAAGSFLQRFYWNAWGLSCSAFGPIACSSSSCKQVIRLVAGWIGDCGGYFGGELAL